MINRHSDTLISCVIFKSVFPFLETYFSSLYNQTDRNFDLLIMVDDFEEFEYNYQVQNREIIYLREKLTPATIRYRIIKYAIANNYTNLIFSDTDDFYSAERVKECKKALLESDFCFNELSTVDQNNNLIHPQLLGGVSKFNEPILISDIIDCNVIGLSNSAVRVESLEEIYIPDDIVAVDWWIYSLLLLTKSRGLFLTDILTFYRQSTNNTVGISNQLSESSLETGCRVKEIHYKNLLEYSSKKIPQFSNIFKDKLNSIQELKLRLEDTAFKENYIDVINKNYTEIYKGWWSEIIDLNEWRKYSA